MSGFSVLGLRTSVLWLSLLLVLATATANRLYASKVYKWVDEKGQTHFTTTPPTTSNTVPLKTSPKDIEQKKDLKGVWWSKEGDSTIRVEFKANHVKFDTLRETRSGIVKKPYLLATYDVQDGRLFTGFSFHVQSSLRSNSALWTIFKPGDNVVLLSRESGQSAKSNWAFRKLKLQRSHPTGAPEGDFFCVQRPNWLLKTSRGIFVWIDKKSKQAVQGSYVKWEPPMLLLDRVFDVQDPVNPRAQELFKVEVLTIEPHRLIMKLPSEEVLACKPA
jgi:hypothetical protein